MMMTVLKFPIESVEENIFSPIKTLVKYHIAFSSADLAICCVLVEGSTTIYNSITYQLIGK